MLAVWKQDRPALLPASDAICTGLQLANFCQDVAVDWTKGRVYVPLDEMAALGVGVEAIAHARADAHWRRLMQLQTRRARDLLEQGYALARALPWRPSLEIRAVIAGGLAILDRIDAVGGDVFRHRPVLRGTDWARVAWRALFPGERRA